MDEDDPLGLDTVSTGALIEELFSRFDHAVFIARKDRSENEMAYKWDEVGDFHVCMALCQIANLNAYRRWAKTAKDVDET